jgi:hypothetical protein
MGATMLTSPLEAPLEPLGSDDSGSQGQRLSNSPVADMPWAGCSLSQVKGSDLRPSFVSPGLRD